MVSPEDFGNLKDEVVSQGVLQLEIHRQLILLNSKLGTIPCDSHTVQLKWLERLSIGCICFSGSVVLTIIANFEKIKKVFT